MNKNIKLVYKIPCGLYWFVKLKQSFILLTNTSTTTWSIERKISFIEDQTTILQYVAKIAYY